MFRVTESRRSRQAENRRGTPLDVNETITGNPAKSHPEINGVICSWRGRQGLREINRVKSLASIDYRLKIARMRRDAVNAACHKGVGDVAGPRPAGEVSRFKPAVGDKVCFGGIGN